MGTGGRETGNSSEREIPTTDKKGIENSGETGRCTSEETVELRNGGRQIWEVVAEKLGTAVKEKY